MSFYVPEYPVPPPAPNTVIAPSEAAENSLKSKTKMADKPRQLSRNETISSTNSPGAL